MMHGRKKHQIAIICSYIWLHLHCSGMQWMHISSLFWGPSNVTKRMSEDSLAIASSTQVIFCIRLLALERKTSLPYIDRWCSPLLHRYPSSQRTDQCQYMVREIPCFFITDHHALYGYKTRKTFRCTVLPSRFVLICIWFPDNVAVDVTGTNSKGNFLICV